MEPSDPFDVLIIGAGVSGIGMACHLARECPHKRVAILERRGAIGGTWDLFRYPGVRSDSDMMTFGYRLRPWTEARVLADGPSIRAYVTQTARAFGVDGQIRFGLRSTAADWSGAQRRWTITAVDEASGQTRRFSCGFLVAATGYFNHDQGHRPDFAGVHDFKGRCIHPQHWPEGLDCRGRRVVVIGSGATAVTLVPALAAQGAHVTMLQRSPGYVFSLPEIDQAAVVLKRFLPEGWVHALLRGRNIFLQRSIYKLSRRFPGLLRRLLLGAARRQLGPGFDMAHFTPSYSPWDQRLCVVPNGDLFKVLRDGRASVVTGQIERFTATGILLTSGATLDADIVVTATGLQLQTLGGMALAVDGQPVSIGDRMTYKGVLVQDLPNFATLFGYTNISWTLKIDLAAEYVCRLLNDMARRGAEVVTPRAPPGQAQAESILASLQAGYVQRGDAVLPRQGRALPWRVLHHFERDRRLLRQPIDDPALEWSRAA